MKNSMFAVAALAICVGAAQPVSAQDIQERVIRFGHLNNPDHPVSMGVKKFAELVAAKSGGKMQVKEFPSNQLGSEQQQTSALQGGVQEMQSPATTSLVGIVKDYGVIDFPFTVGSHAQAFALPGWPARQGAARKTSREGPGWTCLLGPWIPQRHQQQAAHRQAGRPGRPQAARDPNPVFLDTFKAFKANPVPMSFSELYTALETKTVDGQENPYSVILSNKFYEVQKYVSGTGHVYGTNIILVSGKFWDKLSPAERKIMQDAAIEARDYQRQVSQAAAGTAVKELTAKGHASSMTCREPSAIVCVRSPSPLSTRRWRRTIPRSRSSMRRKSNESRN
jgi:TRAP-type C4-dicarboxylate transport system substrate-binding protein